MKKGLFLLMVSLSLLIIAVKLFFPYSDTVYDQYYSSFDVATRVIEIIILIMIARNGTTIKTVYFRIICFCIGFYILGALFKIMHWQGSSIIISVSLLSVAITYVIRFIKKNPKTVLDIFKMIWVILIAVESILRLEHLIRTEDLILGELVGWFVILFSVIEAYKKGLFNE